MSAAKKSGRAQAPALPFLTDFDPQSRTSGSIDPLGALRAYGALVDTLLPGVTTVTTRSRYLSMLCWGLANAQAHRGFARGPSGISARRAALEPFERLWALACVVARNDGGVGAADGLRGVTFAQSWLEVCAPRNEVTPAYRLLRYQSRAGGAATYWSMLSGAGLIEDDGALTQSGLDLAKEFPGVPLNQQDREKLADPTKSARVTISLKDLTKWANDCHLGAASGSEPAKLVDALRADPRRDAVARALTKYATEKELPSVWLAADFRRFKPFLADRVLLLCETVDAVLVFERFHESALAVFRTLLWWGTERSDEPLAALYQDPDFCAAVGDAREFSNKFLSFEQPLDKRARAGLESLHGLARDIARATDARDTAEAILRHHQKTKDARAWIAESAGHVLRPGARYQLSERPSRASGKGLTHPYRLEPFVRMLIENRGLKRPVGWKESHDG